MTYVIAEIGINHNGDLNIAKELIKSAKESGCNAVKFQKRTIEDVYTPDELDVPRESPFGTTNREQKNGLEFSKEDYVEINRYCKELDIDWFASAWDIDSQKFLRQFNCKYNKVASAMLTIEPLLHEIAKEQKHTFISTGMSTLEEVDKAVEIFRKHDCPFELMHCCSSYPMKNEDANLSMINTLKMRYGCDVGYSGHETGLSISVAAVAMGATSIERHITLDRAMYGSDQAASLEIGGLQRLVAYVRDIETALGSPVKKVMRTEVPIAKKLRKYNTL